MINSDTIWSLQGRALYKAMSSYQHAHKSMQHVHTPNSIKLGCCILRVGGWADYEYSPFSNRSASAWLLR